MKKLNAREIIQQLVANFPEPRQDFLQELQAKVSNPYRKIFMKQIRRNNNTPLLEVIRSVQAQADEQSNSEGAV